MKEAEFRDWLTRRRHNGKALTTVGNRVAWCRSVEKALPELGFAEADLDAVFAAGQWTRLLDEVAKMRADWRHNEAAARVISPQSENPRGQMANARNAIGKYGRFANGDDPNYDGGKDDDDETSAIGLDAVSIETAMDEFDRLGAAAFYAKYERGAQGIRYYVVRGSVRYPSKAIANAAYEARHGERDHYGGTGARKALEACGYTIVEGGSYDTAAFSAASARTHPTNLILYGPPGTGKTYATARKAVELCGESAPEDRNALMERYRGLQQDGRIAFVTFHQNYSYEDFVEGLRPEPGGDDGQSTGFRLEPRPGIFREICALAEQARTRSPARPGNGHIDLAGRRFWKMGLGAIGSEDEVYDDAIAGGYIALGWGGAVDWSDARFSSYEAIKTEWHSAPRDSDSPSNWTQLFFFRCEMKPGDIVIVPYGNSAFRAVAEITGDYYFVSEAAGYYAQRRPVRWLLTLDDALPLDTILDGKFTMRTLYALAPKRVNEAALARLLPGSNVGDGLGDMRNEPDQFVLIIDEINRANVSKVFGELITLLEPDKRSGTPGALTVTLPYSKKRDFGVPANLHIIGTMNTADRSIALLDTALRRRFDFEELMPAPELLGTVDGIDLPALLRTINERVEYLFDREHQIGHAYFMGCASHADVDAVMRHKVIPLLAEYFYEDWGKVARVLGDAGDGTNGFLTRKALAAPPGLGGDYEDAVRYRWSVRDSFDYGLLAGG